MSYILDALKKAERERGLAEVPKLETVHDLQVKKKTGVWIVAGFSVLCLITAGWLFFSTSSGRIDSKTPESTAPAQNAVVEDFKPLPENLESIAQSSNTLPVSDDIALNLPAPKAINAPAAAVSEAKPLTAATKPEISVTTVIAPPPAAAKTEDVIIQKSPPVSVNAVLSKPDAATPAVVRRESQRVSENLPSLREISASMKVSVHIYSENPEESLVFINGTQYKEGAYLGQDCVLESINPDGLVLKRGDETYVLRLNGM